MSALLRRDTRPATAEEGDVWVHPGGNVAFIWRNGRWEEEFPFDWETTRK